MKPILSWLLSLVGVVLGVFTLYQLFTIWVPSDGWTSNNLVSIGFAFFMIVGGGTAIFKRATVMLPKGEDSKRCGACGAMVPLIARFCRECGKRLSVAKT